MKTQIIAKKGNWLTQKHLPPTEKRVFATKVTGDVRVEDWIEVKETEITK